MPIFRRLDGHTSLCPPYERGNTSARSQGSLARSRHLTAGDISAKNFTGGLKRWPKPPKDWVTACAVVISDRRYVLPDE